MQKERDTFKSLGATIAVVVRDNRKSVQTYWDENKLGYIGIPDEEKKLGTLYKQEWKLLKLGLMPAMFIIDKNGVIRFVHYSDSMSDIPKNATVFDVLKGLQSPPK